MEWLRGHTWEQGKGKQKRKPELIRQYYFRVWSGLEEWRGNKYAAAHHAAMLEEIGAEYDLSGWIIKTLDKPMGVHGVVQCTREKYKKFYKWLDFLAEHNVIGFILNRKPGYVKDYVFDGFQYSDNPIANLAILQDLPMAELLE